MRHSIFLMTPILFLYTFHSLYWPLPHFRAGTIVLLAYVHGAKDTFFRLRHPKPPNFLRNSLIIIVRHLMANKSDKVRK